MSSRALLLQATYSFSEFEAALSPSSEHPTSRGPVDQNDAAPPQGLYFSITVKKFWGCRGPLSPPGTPLRRGGGVCLLVKPNLHPIDVSVASPWEIIAIDTFSGSPSQHRIVCGYFFPSEHSAELSVGMQELCATLETLCETSIPITILGDFNLSLIDWRTCIAVGGPGL